MDVNQASKKWGISASTVRKYCADRITPSCGEGGGEVQMVDSR